MLYSGYKTALVKVNCFYINTDGPAVCRYSGIMGLCVCVCMRMLDKLSTIKCGARGVVPRRAFTCFVSLGHSSTFPLCLVRTDLKKRELLHSSRNG